MHSEMIFQTWAPESARWSPWVKPVLFAFMPSEPPPAELSVAEPIDVSWAPPASRNVGFVIDLPGPSGVAVGLDLAALGYRPVPLYNAIPMSSYMPEPGEILPTRAVVKVIPTIAAVWHGHDMPEPDEILSAPALVQVIPIIAAMWHGRARFLEHPLPPDAPPAFLLDWNRDGAGRQPSSNSFDNRSVSFTTDFPSATFLLTHGIQRVVLVQPAAEQPRTDLAHTLRRWQESGIEVQLKRLDVPGSPVPCVVRKPSWFGWAWQRVLVAAGLIRGDSGSGFGGWVQPPSSG